MGEKMESQAIGILLREPSPHQREPSLRRRSFVAKVKEVIARRLGFQIHKPTILGYTVAARALAEALMLHGSSYQYCAFLAGDGAFGTRTTYASVELSTASGGSVSISPMADILPIAAKGEISAWFDLNGNPSTLLGMRAAQSNSITPLAVLLHSFSYHSFIHNQLLKVLLGDVYPCDTMICTSRAAHQAISGILDDLAVNLNSRHHTDLRYRGRIDVIPLCVDTETFKPQPRDAARQRLGLPQNALIFLYLGRISAADKADLFPLIRVLQRIASDNVTARPLMVIAGTGQPPAVAALMNYARELGIAGMLLVKLNVPSIEKPQLYAAADLFLFPVDNMQESFGLAPVEAMACGIPQIAADWDGCRDTVVHGETGFLVPTYWTRCDSDLRVTGDLFGWPYDHLSLAESVVVDPEALYRYLQCMITNPDLRCEMGRKSRKRALAEFGYAAIAKVYERLWDELINTARISRKRNIVPAYHGPEYFRWFSHYASGSLGDSTILRLVQGEPESYLKELISCPQPDVVQFRILEPEILWRVVSSLKVEGVPCRNFATGASGDCDFNLSAAKPMGDIVNAICRAEGSRYHSEHVRRHIMWLIKQNIIQPADKI